MDNDVVARWDQLEAFANIQGGVLKRHKDRAVYSLHDGAVWLTVGKRDDFQVILRVDTGETGYTVQYAADSIEAVKLVVEALTRHVDSEQNWVPRYVFEPGVLHEPAHVVDRKNCSALTTPGSTSWDRQVSFVLDFLDGQGANVVEMDSVGIPSALVDEIRKRRPDITVVDGQCRMGATITIVNNHTTQLGSRGEQGEAFGVKTE